MHVPLVPTCTQWGVHAAKWNAAAPGVSRQFANHAATAATGAVITGVVGIEACHDWLSNRQVCALTRWSWFTLALCTGVVTCNHGF